MRVRNIKPQACTADTSGPENKVGTIQFHSHLVGNARMKEMMIALSIVMIAIVICALAMDFGSNTDFSIGILLFCIFYDSFLKSFKNTKAEPFQTRLSTSFPMGRNAQLVTIAASRS
jgi:hypothetical protein